MLHAAEPTPEQTREIMAVAEKLRIAFENGDDGAIISNTHPKIYSLFGGREEFKKKTTLAIADMMAKGVRMTDNEFGKLSPLYEAGADKLCFVPRTFTMHIGDKKIRTSGFLVAVQTEGAPWMFLDGAAFAQKPELLKILFPLLPDNLPLPEVRYTPIE